MRILFVCSGNICRSPTAQVVFEHIVRREAPDLAVEVDSAGIGDWHVGSPPDRRSQAAARRRGFDLSGLRARQITLEDFRRFELILAMDMGHLHELRRRAPVDAHERIRLFLEFAEDCGFREVPDPYYGGEAGFEQVLDLVEEGARGLLQYLRSVYR